MSNTLKVMCTIRRVDQSEQSRAIALIAHLLGDDGFATQEAAEDLAEWMRRPATLLYGAFAQNGELVGIALIVPYDSFYYAQAICVRPHYRGCGLGGRLLRAAMRNCDAWPVWAKIADHNHVSAALFAREGFAKREHDATPSPLTVDKGTEYFPYVRGIVERSPLSAGVYWDWYRETLRLDARIRQLHS